MVSSANSLVELFRDGEQPLVHRSLKEGSAAHPVGEGRTVEGDALASINLGLTIERQWSAYLKTST